MMRSLHVLSVSLIGLLVALVAVSNPVGQKSVSAAPPQIPMELRFVPRDAAFFLHADIAAIWTSDLLQTLRDAEKTSFAKLEEVLKTFGVKNADLKSITIFFPKIKRGRDDGRAGIVLRFTEAFDQKKLEAGFANLFPKDTNVKVKVLVPAERLALVLINLDEEYSRPLAADAEGHLTPAIEAAASGKHTLVLGTTFGSLPDELQGNDLPREAEPFQPIFQSHAAYATVDLGKSLTVNVHVKSKDEKQAADAEKSLAAAVDLITEGIDKKFLPELGADAKNDAGLKDGVKVVKAVLTAVKGAKVSVKGSEARLTATLPLDGLPLGSAYTAAVRQVELAAASIESSNNLKQIGLSFHNYHSAYEKLPPAAVCDKKGKPLLSWRVLILPYLEQDELYKQFKLDEPWDSEHNKKLLAKMPKTYRLPGAKPDSTDTHYRTFVGKDAGLDWVNSGTLVNITDGASNTLAVITAADAVPWTKPDELEYDTEKDPTKLFGLVVGGRAQVLMFDGSTRTLKKLPSKQTLHALITKAGGEVIGDDF